MRRALPPDDDALRLHSLDAGRYDENRTAQLHQNVPEVDRSPEGHSLVLRVATDDDEICGPRLLLQKADGMVEIRAPLDAVAAAGGLPEDLFEACESREGGLADVLDGRAHGHGGLAIAPRIIRHACGHADEARAQAMREIRSESYALRGVQPVIDRDHEAGVRHADILRPGTEYPPQCGRGFRRA